MTAGLRATLLGTGSPMPDPDRCGPSTLVELDGERFLVDAGSASATGWRGVASVPCSGRVCCSPTTTPTTPSTSAPVRLALDRRPDRAVRGVGPAGTRKQIELLQEYPQWDFDVRRAKARDRPLPTMLVTEFEDGRILDVGGVRVSTFVVDHGHVKPAFGFRFEGAGRAIVVSGDTCPCENLVRWSHGADCLIHECSREAAERQVFLP